MMIAWSSSARLLAIAAAALAAAAGAGAAPLQQQQQQQQQQRWPTFSLPRAAGEKLEALRGARTALGVAEPQALAAAAAAAGLPAAFDARARWPGAIHGVLNQGQCGSCWAFAATECLSDRLAIHSAGRVDVVLSPQDLLSCEDENLGCLMGSPPDLAWRHLRDYGVKTMACVPYVDGDGGRAPACLPTGKCANASAHNTAKYFARDYYHVGSFIEPSAHTVAIMTEIYNNGPVDTTFNVWDDFMAYNGGVYRHQSGGYAGLHSVKIVGWGEDSGTPYWLIQNSWGANWGPCNGFFKILRGADECFIEAAVYAGMPKLP